MATTNLSVYDIQNLPDATPMRIGIVVSEWNSEITDALLSGCVDVLKSAGIATENLHIIYVPGSFELPLGAQLLLENKNCDGVICLGCVIRGETPHFEFVCNACAQGVMEMNFLHNKPVIFGVLTDNNIEQSRARSGGALGNKGTEAAVTAIKMIALRNQLSVG